MTNTVLLKRSSVANSVPLAGNLQPGELAINYNDGNLFYKNTSNVVTVIASNRFVSVSGNITGGNVITGGVVSTAGIVGTGNIDFVSSGNVSLGAVGNIHISGGSSGYVLSTNGSGTLSWVAQSGGSGGSTITVDDFTGDGSTTEFTLSVTPPGIDYTTVNYNGVIQLRTGYTLSGANIVFATPPVANSSIEVTSISATITGAAGSNTQVQFNNGGNLGASSAFTFNTASNVLSVIGNVAGNYFIGKGSLLTGVNTSGNKITNGTSEVNIGSSNGNANVSINGTSNVAVFTSSGLNVTGATSASGNVTGAYFIGNGSLLTGIAGSYANADVAAYLASGTDSSNIVTTANVSGGNVLTSGIMSAVGNAIANTFLGNLQGSNVTVTVNLVVSGTTDLGNISNVKISGGTSGQAITTDGAGNLSFSPLAASPAPMPLVVNTGDTVTIPANYQGLFAIPIEVDGTLEILGVLVEV